MRNKIRRYVKKLTEFFKLQLFPPKVLRNTKNVFYTPLNIFLLVLRDENPTHDHFYEDCKHPIQQTPPTRVL